MKAKKLQNLIKKFRNELTWPTLDKTDDTEVVRIVSNPQTRAHTLFIPDEQKYTIDNARYLHELAHAILCEQVHPVFAASCYFANDLSKDQFTILAPALNAACDWFVGHWLLEKCPAHAKEELQERFAATEKVLELPQAPPIDIFLDSSLTVAQAITYLDEPVDCGGLLKDAVDAFISIAPGRPSADAYATLVNRLMAIYTPLRARIVGDREYSVWEVFTE